MANDKRQESVSQADGTAPKDEKGETQANPKSIPQNVKTSPEDVKANVESVKSNAGNGKLNLKGANPSSQSTPTAAKPDASQPGTAQPVAKDEPRGVQVVRDDSRQVAKIDPSAESTEGGRVTQALDGSKGASTMDSAGEVGSATGQGTLEVNETEVKTAQPPVQSDKKADKVEEKEEKKEKKDEAA